MEVFPWFIAISLFGTVLAFCDTGNGLVRNFQFLIHDDIHSKSVTGLRKNIEAPNLLHYFRNQLAWYSSVLLWDRFFPKMQLTFGTDKRSDQSNEMKLDMHPSSMIDTQSAILTILPMIQWRPTTDLLMVVFSETLVESPMIVSTEIWAFWSMREQFSGSVGRHV